MVGQWWVDGSVMTVVGGGYLPKTLSVCSCRTDNQILIMHCLFAIMILNHSVNYRHMTK